ncbi:MAG: hypothetical protein KGM15_09115 [Pseudomonadota bacterium]|nr:hypothetical protein [Pseudomonadota bacterium]
MAILTLLLGVILLALGLGGLALSVNLIPTEMGMLYALSGVVFLAAAAVVVAVAALIARLDRIVAPQPKPKPAPEPEPPQAEPPSAEPPPAEPSPAPEDEVNVNRSGHLPSLRAIEEAIGAPEDAPKVVGRYSAGGARYMIFSDGAIEAETDQGAFRFASMAEFKAFIAGRPPRSPQT